MKVISINKISLLLSLIMLLFSAQLHAEAIQKFGFINTERIYKEAVIAKQIATRLEAEFSPRLKNLEAMRIQGIALRKEIEDVKTTESNKKKKLAELEQYQRIYNSELMQYQNDYSLRRNEEFIVLQRAANEVIVELAEKEGYDLVVQDVVYVNIKYDITDAVINELNKRTR